MPKLAFLTVGVFHEAVGSPRVQGFVDRIPSVYNAADQSDGFDSRSIRDVNTWLHSWGPVVLPSCYGPIDSESRVATTLSLWRDLESVAAFTYHGPHGEALTKRKEWFESRGLPVYVAWWVPDEQSIDWKEGASRLDHLHAHGPTAAAFHFSKPFDAEGKPCRLDREAFKKKAEKNTAEVAARQVSGK